MSTWKFVLAARNAERRLILILRADRELHIGHNLGEEVRAQRLVYKLVDVRERLYRPLRDGSGVEAAVVLTEAPRAVRLPREYNRCSLGAWEALEGTIQPRSSRKATCFPHSLSSPCDKRFFGRDRGIGCSLVSMRSSKGGPARGLRSGERPGGGACEHVRVFASFRGKLGQSPVLG